MNQTMQQATSATKSRRIASNELELPDGSCLPLQVVEIKEGWVVSHYDLKSEIAHTEWLQGKVCLATTGDGRMRAYYKGKQII